MNKDAVRVNQIDLPAIFPSLQLLESLRTAWSIPCLIAAALVLAAFDVSVDGAGGKAPLDWADAAAPFVTSTIGRLIRNFEMLFVYGINQGLAVFAILMIQMISLGFGAVAIARLTAVVVHRNERSGVLRSAKFSAGCWRAILVSTTLATMIGVTGWLFFRMSGKLVIWYSEASETTSTPNIGLWLSSLLLLMGFYVLLTGWMLGLSAIAIDRVDGAEALSRGISYVLSRFRRTSWFLVIITLIAKLSGVITWWCMTLSGQIALQFVNPRADLPNNSAVFAPYRNWGVECVQLSTFCCGMSLAYLILRQMIDNVDRREISDQNHDAVRNAAGP